MAKHLNGASLQGCTVLVTEDEPLIALDIQQAIEAAGGHAVLGTRLSDALQVIDAGTLSAAVMDFRLGGNALTAPSRRSRRAACRSSFIPAIPPWTA